MFLLFSPTFLFLSQSLRNANRCWLHFQRARSVTGQKNNWREHLFSTRPGNWIPFPNHTWESKTKRHYPLPFLLSQLKISTSNFHPLNPLCSVWWATSEWWRRRLDFQFSPSCFTPFWAAPQRHHVVASHKPYPSWNSKHYTGANERVFLFILSCNSSIVPVLLNVLVIPQIIKLHKWLNLGLRKSVYPFIH